MPKTSNIIYLLSSTQATCIISFFFFRSGDAEIMQTGLALFLDNLLKLIIILVQVFVANKMRWVQFVVIAVVQMVRFGLLVSTSPRVAFFRNSFPLFSEVNSS